MGLFFIVWFLILSFKAEIQIKKARQIKGDELENTYSHQIPKTDSDITEALSRCQVAKLKTHTASPPLTSFLLYSKHLAPNILMESTQYLDMLLREWRSSIKSIVFRLINEIGQLTMSV